MPSSDEIERPPEALAVARRYLRRERPLSALVVVLVVSIFLGTYLSTSLLPAVAVAAVLLVVARAPILQSNGTVRLRTDDDPEMVREEFAGPVPPVLPFQWGVADEVTDDGEMATYRVSYLFGLRSADVAVQRQTETTPEGNHRVELDIEVGGRPWATYVSTISGDEARTIVDVEYTSNRRFGLRRVPQQMFAERYRDGALAAQGYTVVERNAHFGL